MKTLILISFKCLHALLVCKIFKFASIPDFGTPMGGGICYKLLHE